MSVYLVTHFTGIFVYAFPSENENKLKSYVYPFVYPYFHQSWGMFVPIPKQNYNIYVKYEGSEWQDVFNEIVLEHQKGRLRGYENISLALSSAIRYYASSVKRENTVGRDDGQNVNLSVIRKMITQYLTLNAEGTPKNLKMIIRIKDVKGNKDHSHYYLN